MPPHIRFLLRHAAFGAAIAAVFVALLLWSNVGNLWHLVSTMPEGPLAVFLLWAFCTITFGSAQIGIRIMMMGDRDRPTGGGRKAPEALRLAVPVAPAPRRP